MIKIDAEIAYEGMYIYDRNQLGFYIYKMYVWKISFRDRKRVNLLDPAPKFSVVLRSNVI